MTMTVTGMRSNKPVTMDIEQLRGWAMFMDRAMVASLVATIVAVAALGITTWLSFRFNGAVRAHEYAAIHRYKVEMGKHAAELEQEVSRARERTLELEQAASSADARAAQAARETRGRCREGADGGDRCRRSPQTRGRTRKAGQGGSGACAGSCRPRLLRRKRHRRPGRKLHPKAPRQAARPSHRRSSRGLKKYAGTKAAVYVLDEAPDAPAVAATISGYLSDAGWAPLTWTWTGVGGIVGVVVLIKDGSDPATDEAASAILEALRSAGFNAAKGNWPADWRRFRGTLNGPQSPGPTEAPIRIVIGARAR